MARNAIGDAGAFRLAEALPRCGKQLTHLGLLNNLIGDAGALEIARASSFEIKVVLVKREEYP